MKGTIICYGDSNTNGYDPRSFMGDRYGKDIRWTGVLAEKTDWSIRNHGMNGAVSPILLRRSALPVSRQKSGAGNRRPYGSP